MRTTHKPSPPRPAQVQFLILRTVEIDWCSFFSLSFISVPQPTGISERQPFLMCWRKFSIWSRVSFFSFHLQTNIKAFKIRLDLVRTCCILGSFATQVSFLSENKGKFICKLITMSFAFPGTVCVTHMQVWNKSRSISPLEMSVRISSLYGNSRLRLSFSISCPLCHVWLSAL